MSCEAFRFNDQTYDLSHTVVPFMQVVPKDADLNGERVAARGCFENNQNETGWMTLDIQTNEKIDDEVQAEAAGILEGYFTRYRPNKTF